MAIVKQVVEMATVYDPGGDYLYRVRWSVEHGHTLQRRQRPNPEHKFHIWDRQYVQNYIQLGQFDPADFARPVMKFDNLFEVEAIIERFVRGDG